MIETTRPATPEEAEKIQTWMNQPLADRLYKMGEAWTTCLENYLDTLTVTESIDQIDSTADGVMESVRASFEAMGCQYHNASLPEQALWDAFPKLRETLIDIASDAFELQAAFVALTTTEVA